MGLIRSHLCSRCGWELIILCLSCPRTHHTSCLLSLAEFMIKVHVSYYNISWCCINPPSPVLPLCASWFFCQQRKVHLVTLMTSGCFYVSLWAMGKKQFKFNIYSVYSRLWFKSCPTNELACPRFQNRAVIDFDFTWVVSNKSIIRCKTRKFAKGDCC